MLSIEDRDRYYAEAGLFAALFGIPQDALPQGWADFAGYVDQMLASDLLAVSDAARHIAAELFAGAGTCWRMPLWYRAVTAGLLPPRLRQDFGLAYGTAEHRSAKQATAVLRCVYPWIPSSLRYVAPYHEARSRLAGRERPRALTQALNRFWIGQTSMETGGSCYCGICGRKGAGDGTGRIEIGRDGRRKRFECSGGGARPPM